MSQIEIDSYNDSVEVVYHAYIYPRLWSKVYCIDCFEKEHCEITIENEYMYLSRCYIKLSQFTDTHHTNQSNYCTTCATPLYFINTERCLLSNPTLNKWLQRFNLRKHYGLRGGGI